MMNSGSYFVIQASVLGYYIVTYFINKACATFGPKYSFTRKLGMKAYEDNYWSEFVKATYKLFLESYFDIVMCVMLNMFAFFNMEDEWFSFFYTLDDAFCSTITVVFSTFIIFFPFISWYMIDKN